MSEFSRNSKANERDAVGTTTTNNRYVPPHLRGSRSTDNNVNALSPQQITTGPGQNGGRRNSDRPFDPNYRNIPRTTFRSNHNVGMLSAANLQTRNANFVAQRQNRDYDDDLETTTIFSRLNLTGNNLSYSGHGMKRMDEREIGELAVAKVIKRGIKTSDPTSGRTSFQYQGIVVILGWNADKDNQGHAKDLQALEEKEIDSIVKQQQQVDIKAHLITVYKDLSITGISGELYWHWLRLLLCICSKDEENLALAEAGAINLVSIIKDPSEDFQALFHSIQVGCTPEEFRKMLNWVVAEERNEAYYKLSRQRTLLTTAAYRGYTNIVQLLMDHEADPAVQSRLSPLPGMQNRGSTLHYLLKSGAVSPWVSCEAVEDLALLIAKHSITTKAVFAPCRSYSVLHRAIHMGMIRLVAYILQHWDNDVFEYRNKKGETAATLASSRWMDLTPFLPPDQHSRLISFVPREFQSIPPQYDVLAQDRLFGKRFHLHCLLPDGSYRAVVGNANGLLLGEDGDALVFAFEQPEDIYGAPQTLGPKGLVRWFVQENALEEDSAAQRCLQRNSVRHFAWDLKLNYWVHGTNPFAFDFAWSVFVPSNELLTSSSSSIENVIIGNSFNFNPIGVFVVVSPDGNKLRIQECSHESAVKFRMSPISY